MISLCWRRRVVLAWGDARRVSRFLLAARAAGARDARVLHPRCPPDADQILAEEARDLGLTGCLPTPATPRRLDGPHDSDLPPSWWHVCHLDRPDASTLAAPPDVVVDASQLIHWPDPAIRLRALAGLGARHVLLETPVVTVDQGLAQAGFAPGDVWHAAAMSPAQSAAAAAHWADRGVELEQYGRFPHGFTAAQAEAAGLHATAWWTFTDREGLRAMLRDAGLEPRRMASAWGGRSAVVVAEASGAAS